MKNKFLLLSLLFVSAVSFGQWNGVYPPFGPPPSNDVTFRPLTLQYINTPDVAGGLDTIKLYPYAFDIYIQPSDSLADSIVYCIPQLQPVQAPQTVIGTSGALNSQTGQLFSTLTFVVVANNAAVKTKVKFRNKYNTAFTFSVAAADSTVSLTAKQRLVMKFQNVDGKHYSEIFKSVK